MIFGLILLAIIICVVISCVKVVRQAQALVIERLGAYQATWGTGLHFKIPIFDRVARRVDLKEQVVDFAPQPVITKDNVPIKVNAVVYFRVLEPSRSMVEVEDYIMATSQLSQTTLRSVIGRAELDEVLSARDKINMELQQIIDDRTDPWGIKVSAVELKELELPEGMKRAMAKQAEAERERRAKIIAAAGELEAAEKLTQAAEVMERTPITLQLRYLQTMKEIAGDKNSTTFFPLPMDIITPFLRFLNRTEEKK